MEIPATGRIAGGLRDECQFWRAAGASERAGGIAAIIAIALDKN